MNSKNKIQLVENQVKNGNDSTLINTFTDVKVFDGQKDFDDDELDDGYFDNEYPDETFQNFYDYY